MNKDKTLKCRRHPNRPHVHNANFCVFCGKPLHKYPVCPNCGTKRDVRGSFCQNCGHPQNLTEKLLVEAFSKDGVTEIKLGRAKRA